MVTGKRVKRPIARSGSFCSAKGLVPDSIWVGGWQGTDKPVLERRQVIVFAGNHGVTAQGVSAFPPEVTVQMVANFEHGGAAINQLCKAAGADLSVHALELDRPTADFTKAPAMSEAEVVSALRAGWDAVDPEAHVLVVGEMGIGNTTSAAAIALALFGGDASDWTGRGTGVSDDALEIKTAPQLRPVWRKRCPVRWTMWLPVT